jgi:hypothetical protein
VILDIAKAFDTVDRSFVFRIMEAAGCGRPNSCSATLVHTPSLVAMYRRQAGVRQGCPLSPLL